MDATPKEVGGAIDVLEVTTSGARWIQREQGSGCSVLP
jgi:hypothetical protein